MGLGLAISRGNFKWCGKLRLCSTDNLVCVPDWEILR